MRKIVAVLSLVILGTAMSAQAGVVTFQQGVDGYTGTRDTQVRGAAADTNYGSGFEVSIDASDGGQPTHSLLKFEGIIGNNAGQIPTGSTINSATLRVVITSTGSGWLWHRMLKDWDETTATWNSLVNGIQADDVEAVATPTFQAGANNSSGNIPTGAYTLDLTADVQAWANGAANYGWGILPFMPNGTNGIDFYSRDYDGSEAGFPLPDVLPLLTVDFSPVPEPHSLGLLATGLVLAGGLLQLRKRK